MTRTFTVTVTTTDEADCEGPFARTVAQDHSSDSLFVLLDGLLEGITGVKVEDAVEQEPIA